MAEPIQSYKKYHIYSICFIFDVTVRTDKLFCNLSDMQSCKACRREQGETPCVSITFPFTASHKTREKLPNRRKMQMCEFLCSLLKLITQTVTRFDRTHWKHSRNVLTTSLRHSHDMPFIMQSYDYRLHLHCIVLCVYFD